MTTSTPTPDLFGGYTYLVKPSAIGGGRWTFFVLKGEKCVESNQFCKDEEDARAKALAEIARREAADLKKAGR